MNSTVNYQISIFFMALAFMVTVYVVALYKLQIIDGTKYKRPVKTKSVRKSLPQGNICDRYGRIWFPIPSATI